MWSPGYNRGREDGSILARLDQHDNHFSVLNGSMAKVASSLDAVNMSVQRLSDEAVSRDRTVVTTAAALKDAEAVRREHSTTAWTPLSRIAAGITAAVGMLTLALFFRYGVPTSTTVQESPPAPATHTSYVTLSVQPLERELLT